MSTDLHYLKYQILSMRIPGQTKIYLTVVPDRYNESPMDNKKSIIVIEFIISHDGKNWIARNDRLSAQAPTLEEMEVDASVLPALF